MRTRLPAEHARRASVFLDACFAVLFVGAVFLYHWVVRRPLEPHNHVADLGLMDVLVAVGVVWWSSVHRGIRSGAVLVATVGSVVALAYALFQVDYMLCRQSWLACAGTGPGISGFLSAYAVLGAVLVVRDAVEARAAGLAWRRPRGPSLAYLLALGLLYGAYRVGMPPEPRHRLVFDLVFLLLVLATTLWFALLDRPPQEREVPP